MNLDEMGTGGWGGMKKSLKKIKFYRMAPVLRPKTMFRKKKTRSE